MEVTLSEDEVVDLRQALDEVISDMSVEIADTDNARYRAGLKERRDRLRGVRAKLDARTD
jgi:hypothetical protein